MNQLRRRVAYIILIVLTGVYLHPEYINAQRMVASLEYSYNPVSSGFDGISRLYGTNDVFLIPELNGGSGFGVSVGGAMEMKNYVYIVFKYSLTSYNASFQNKDLGKTYQNTFGMLFRFYPRRFLPDIANVFTESKLKYYFLTGIDIGILKGNDCHYSEAIPDILNDALFTSLLIPAGAGVSIKLSESFALDIDASYRFGVMMYVRESGSEDNLEIDEDILVSGFRLGVALTFTFGGREK